MPTAPAEILPSDDEGRANRINARRHLAAMDPARREALHAEWLAGEALHDRHVIDAEMLAIVADYEAMEGEGS